MNKQALAPSDDKLDCHYCNYASCDSPNSKNVDCYVEDFCYFSHTVKDSKREAEHCEWFDYLDSFPKN